LLLSVYKQRSRVFLKESNLSWTGWVNETNEVSKWRWFSWLLRKNSAIENGGL
jgi:hypothetical protein